MHGTRKKAKSHGRRSRQQNKCIFYMR